MGKHGLAGWLSKLSRLGAPLGGLGVLLAVLVSCSSDGSTMGGDGPIVRLHLSAVDSTATHAVLNVTAPDPAGQDKSGTKTFPSGPFDSLGISFPLGTRGATSYRVDLFDDADCMKATGTAVLTLNSDGVFDVSVTMTKVDLCGNGATVTVQVINAIGGSGSVSSMPAGISCQGAGTGCTATYMKGTQLTLTPQATAGSFAGWSSASCTGLGNCVLTLTGDVQLQAVFTTCRGWCKETLPFAVTANLNGVTGTEFNNVVVVGDAGTALQWNGTTWQQLVPPSGATVALRAAFAKFGGTVINVAGDKGTILQLKNQGTTWSSITNASMMNLRSIAIAQGGSPDTFFVGDGGTALVLANAGTSVSAKNSGTTVNFHAIAQNPSDSGEDLLIGGAVSGAQGVARSWDGNNAFNLQMVLPGANIAGNINALLLGTSTFYAAGDLGAMVSRPKSSGAAGGANTWIKVTVPTNLALRGMWSSTDNNILAVGDMGTVIQYNGVTWSSVTVPTTSNLRAIWGSSSTNIYAVGDGGIILHYLP